MSKKVNSTISTVDETPIFTKSSKISTPFTPATVADVSTTEPIISNTSEPILSQVETSSNRNWIMYGVIGVVILIVLGLLGFGIYMLVKEYKDKKKEDAKPAPKPVPKPAPTKPIPKPVPKPPPKEEDEIPPIVNPVNPTPKPKPKQPNDLIGILVSNEKDREPLFFPLHGRKIAGKGEDMWYYYTKVADIVTPIISKDVECGAKAGCKEMGNNTIVVLKQFPDRKFTAKLYKKRGPEYASQRPYEYLGVLVSEPTGKVPLRLPLYGRELTHRENRWQYYTKVKEVMVPMFYKERDCQEDVGCDELNHGSTLTLDGYGTRIFTVQMKGKQPVKIQPIDPPQKVIVLTGSELRPKNPKEELYMDAYYELFHTVAFSSLSEEGCSAEDVDEIKKDKPETLAKFSKVDSCKDFKKYIQEEADENKKMLIKAYQGEELLKYQQRNDKVYQFLELFVDEMCLNDKFNMSKVDSFLTIYNEILCSEKNKINTSKYDQNDKLIQLLIELRNFDYTKKN